MSIQNWSESREVIQNIEWDVFVSHHKSVAELGGERVLTLRISRLVSDWICPNAPRSLARWSVTVDGRELAHGGDDNWHGSLDAAKKWCEKEARRLTSLGLA